MTASKPNKQEADDPEMYHAWLLGKGYSAASAMRMVAAKFEHKQVKREPDLRGFWKP